MQKPLASIIIAIYNKFEFLERVLAGLETQTVKNFEVILADDGSNQETIASIEKYKQRSPLSIKHLWHEDVGFRKTIMLNKAVMAAESNYLIFVDGDCVPHPNYVEAHLQHRQEGVVLSGRRVNLSEQLTNWLTAERIRAGAIGAGFTLRTFADSVLGKTRDAEKGIYLPSKAFEVLFSQKFKGLLGCNFSLYKKDLLDINGFDERYLAPAVGEDTDPELRLRWAGKGFRSVKNYAIQYHLYHRKLQRPTVNADILAQVKQDKIAFTPFGVKKASTT
ncbi:glycosyltransferase [Cesiribacter sp. SM1]|uniref:glycosyltransferase n=1 Tax=Cesiribacter sp. SM1 TaxID=2861196 RepID=UPI001CD3746B|nr:glycosyltransferase [Cesiribacter sp. SM1]